MYSWVRVGAKCVYVHRSTGATTREPLKYLGVYEVRKVVCHPRTGEVGIYLVGVVNDIHPSFGMEKGYKVSSFRPLIQKTQSEDVEMFLRIAAKAPSNMESTDA